MREQPELAGPVASDPAVSQLVSVLAADLPRVLKAIRAGSAGSNTAADHIETTRPTLASCRVTCAARY